MYTASNVFVFGIKDAGFLQTLHFRKKTFEYTKVNQ